MYSRVFCLLNSCLFLIFFPLYKGFGYLVVSSLDGFFVPDISHTMAVRDTWTASVDSYMILTTRTPSFNDLTEDSRRKGYLEQLTEKWTEQEHVHRTYATCPAWDYYACHLTAHGNEHKSLGNLSGLKGNYSHQFIVAIWFVDSTWPCASSTYTVRGDTNNSDLPAELSC